MSRIEVRLIEGAPVRVGDAEPLALGETRAFDTGGSISVAEETGPAEAVAVDQDVFSPANRPNGAMTAGIAPKMPKSSGELSQFPIEGGRTVERAAADIGVATQGGGPDSADTVTTPGPQPEAGAPDATRLPGGGTAAATLAAGSGGTNPGIAPAGAAPARAAPAPAPAPRATKTSARTATKSPSKSRR